MLQRAERAVQAQQCCTILSTTLNNVAGSKILFNAVFISPEQKVISGDSVSL